MILRKITNFICNFKIMGKKLIDMTVNSTMNSKQLKINFVLDLYEN